MKRAIVNSRIRTN